MPRAFLRGILQKLTAAGILHSAKGKGGGFLLARPSRRIHLIDALRKRLTGLEKNVVDSLSSITIKRLALSRGR